jgi:hypothetical protein
MRGLMLVMAVLGSACGGGEQREDPALTLRMAAPLTSERSSLVTVEDTDVQTNVLVDDPDLRVAVVIPHDGVADIEPAIGIWQPGTDFVVCKAELARDGAWLAFNGPCASGRVLLPAK